MNKSNVSQERLERTGMNKHHVQSKVEPDAKEGYIGETRFKEKPDGTFDKLRKYPTNDGAGEWKPQLGGMNISEEDGVPGLEIVGKNGMKYKIKFEEV